MNSRQRKAMFAKKGGSGLSSKDLSNIESQVEQVEEGKGVSPKTARKIAKETARVADMKTSQLTKC